MLWWRWLRCCFRGDNAADITGYNAGVTVTPHGHAPLQYLHKDECIRSDPWTLSLFSSVGETLLHARQMLHNNGHTRHRWLQAAHRASILTCF